MEHPQRHRDGDDVYAQKYEQSDRQNLPAPARRYGHSGPLARALPRWPSSGRHPFRNTADVPSRFAGSPPAMPPPCQQHPAAGRSTWGQYAVDALFALIFATLAATYATAAQRAMDPRFFAIPAGNDVWFEGDLPMVADTILHRWSTHPRDAKHPLFPLLTTLPSYALRSIGLTGPHRLLAITAVAAAAWGVAVYLLLRLSTSSRRAAVVFAVLAHVTAGAVFWLPTTETWVLGSLSLITPLILVAAERRLNVREGWYVVASALSLSVTVSNWLAGIIAPWSTRPTRRTVQITANALAVVVVLWAAQKSLVPLSSFFVGRVEHSRFMFPLEAGGPGAIARALVFHSVVMPQVVVVPEPKWGTRMSVQRAALGSSGTIGTIATVLWSILLSVGVGALWIRRRTPQARALGLATVAQFAVYLCYGEETFLFAIQIAPLLVTCAAAATWTRHRRWVTALAMVLAVLLALNNLPSFARATRFFAPPSDSVQGPP